MIRSPGRLVAALAGLVLIAGGCADHRSELRTCDQVEEDLRVILGRAIKALGSSDAVGLRGEQDALVRLRVRAQALRMAPPVQAARDSLLVALDAVADGISAAILGARSSVSATTESASGWKERTDRLRSSAAEMKRCEDFLSRAASALEHYHQARARVENGRR